MVCEETFFLTHCRPTESACRASATLKGRQRRTHLPGTSQFDDFPPILVDLDLLLGLDGFFAVSHSNQQQRPDGYWDGIPLRGRPFPCIDEFFCEKKKEEVTTCGK